MPVLRKIKKLIKETKDNPKKTLSKITRAARRSNYRKKRDEIKRLKLQLLKNQAKSNGKQPESLINPSDSDKENSHRERERENLNKISQLEQEVKQLQDKLRRRQDSGYQEDETEPTEQIAKLQEEVQNLQIQLNIANQAAEQVQTVNAGLQTQLTAAQQAQAQAKTAHNEAQTQLATANQAKEQAESQLQSVQNELATANQAKSQALTQNATLQTSLQNTQNELNQQKETTNNQQQTIDNLNQQLSDQQEQNRHSQAQLDHQIEQNEDQKNQYLFDIGIKNRSILFLTGQINNLEQKLGELNQESESLRDELEQGLNDKNKLQNRLNTLLNQKQVLQNKLAGINEKVNNLAFEWEKEKQKNADLQNQHDTLLYQSQFWQQRPSQQAYQSLKRQKDKQQENYTRQINNLQQKIINLREQKTNSANELAELETTAQTYYQISQQNLANAQQELRNTQQELENTQQAQTQAAGQLTYYQTQDEGLRNTIINLQTQLANQQNLNQNLQNQINNHTCPALPIHTDSPCPLVHLPEPHECPVTQECSHENQEKVKEQQIIQQLNEVLGSSEKDLEIIINRIKELIDKPPLTYTITDEVVEQQLQDAQQTILKLEKELSEKETPFGEDLAVIKKLELNSLEELFKQALDSAVIQQIQQATSYQQVVAARQAFLEKRLESKQNIVQVSNLQTIQQERNQLVKQRNLGLVAAGTLLITGLTTTAILGRKVKQLKAVNKNYHSDYQKIKGELEEIMIKMRGLVEEKRG